MAKISLVKSTSAEMQEKIIKQASSIESSSAAAMEKVIAKSTNSEAGKIMKSISSDIKAETKIVTKIVQTHTAMVDSGESKPMYSKVMKPKNEVKQKTESKVEKVEMSEPAFKEKVVEKSSTDEKVLFKDFLVLAL